jgi:hypothetical protein
MKRLLASLLVLTAVCVAAPAFAEGGSGGDDGAMTAAPKAKHRKAKPKPKPAAAKPAGPVPYTTLNPADVPKPTTPQVVSPGPPAAAMTPDALPQPAETNHPPTPSTDVAVAPRTPPPPPPPGAPTVAPREISLKCDTQVTEGKTVVSHGTFYIDLFPSEALPGDHADFKFIFVDPAHKSLIRESVCLDTMCSATVSNSAYYLVNRVTRRGGALRITLDRSKGAFYAEEVPEEGLFSKGGTHLGEQGYCTPQALPNPLF